MNESIESQEQFWCVARRCLHHFHHAPPQIYKRLRELRAKIDVATIEEVELFFHDEPFNIACDVAQHAIPVKSVLKQYLEMRDNE